MFFGTCILILRAGRCTHQMNLLTRIRISIYVHIRPRPCVCVCVMLALTCVYKIHSHRLNEWAAWLWARQMSQSLELDRILSIPSSKHVSIHGIRAPVQRAHPAERRPRSPLASAGLHRARTLGAHSGRPQPSTVSWPSERRQAPCRKLANATQIHSLSLGFRDRWREPCSIRPSSSTQ